MNFGTAISTCMGKYATFSGRASRSEFWWFYLFTVLLSWAASITGSAMYGAMDPMASLPGAIVSLALLLPVLSAGCRRLHDIGKSGWWQLIMLIPLLGLILLIVWFATDTKAEGDRYNLV